VKDASGHGIGGVIVGENENKACIPTVFRYEWPDDIKAEINSATNPRKIDKFRSRMRWLVNVVARNGGCVQYHNG